MKKNMGIFDKSLRILFALIIGLLFYFEVISGTLGLVLMIVAIVLLLTALLNFCPLWAIFGINTDSKKN